VKTTATGDPKSITIAANLHFILFYYGAVKITLAIAEVVPPIAELSTVQVNTSPAAAPGVPAKSTIVWLVGRTPEVKSGAISPQSAEAADSTVGEPAPVTAAA
jgi:hypothetical protein